MTANQLATLFAGRAVMRKKDVARAFGISLRTVERWTRDRTLPRPAYIHGPAWRPIDIQRLLDNAQTPNQRTGANSVRH